MTDDAELLSRYVKARSEPAFSALVQRYFDLVFYAAMRQVGDDVHRARDVSQIVFAKLARRAPKLVGRRTIAGWLYCTTRFTAMHIMRTERRRERREQEVYAMQNLALESESIIEWERLKPVVDDVLHGLSERDRDAVLMRFFGGKPFADIGVSLGITADAARFRVDRALDRMRAGLSKRGVASSSAALALTLSSHASTSAPAGMAATVAASAFSKTASGGGVSISIGILKFMTTAKATLNALTVLLAAALLGEAFLGWSQSKELKRQEVVATRANNAGFARQLQNVRQQIAWLEGERIEASKAATVGRSRGPQPVSTGTTQSTAVQNPEPVAANISQAFTMAMNDPEFRKLLAVSEKTRLNLFYNPLFQKLNLGADRLDKFKELLVDKQQAVGDANRVALSVGFDPDSAYRSIASVQEGINAEIRALLGDDGYAQYQNYEGTRGQRIVVDRLRQSLSYTSTPLSEEQASELVQVLYRNSPASNRPSTNGLGAQVGAGLRERDLSAPILDQNLLDSQGLLSQPQLEMFRQLQLQQKERQRITQKLKPSNTSSGIH